MKKEVNPTEFNEILAVLTKHCHVYLEIGSRYFGYNHDLSDYDFMTSQNGIKCGLVTTFTSIKDLSGGADYSSDQSLQGTLYEIVATDGRKIQILAFDRDEDLHTQVRRNRELKGFLLNNEFLLPYIANQKRMFNSEKGNGSIFFNEILEWIQLEPMDGWQFTVWCNNYYSIQEAKGRKWVTRMMLPIFSMASAQSSKPKVRVSSIGFDERLIINDQPTTIHGSGVAYHWVKNHLLVKVILNERSKTFLVDIENNIKFDADFHHTELIVE